uniref:NADH-ubiquinone oxidoreductase chain 5 n=1 Tax=Polyphylla laticollis mandshurica TaxID=1415276 RepID=A0A0K0K9G9_9SCAR|nr:NADH dehydrogenase subunit 5 [Polyphylla laticollis mandshurica]
MFSICYVYFVFLLVFSLLSFMGGLMFMVVDFKLMLEFELLSLNSTSIIMTILCDWMSLLFMSFVLFISSMVIYYSEEYMSEEININRFIMLVFMFVLSMMLLIISPNLISILLGWDGLGLVSYCLVVYYQNVKSYNAGMVTALTNRIGDVALLMAIAWMMNYGSFNYIYYLECMNNTYEMNVISFLIMMAAMTKSAQIPFSSWLPAAMAAPTPVSSLVHSSTLVTAGVYLLIRFHEGLNSLMLMLLLFIGTMTMFMAGLGANFEFDLKKIIALSTLSQLGLMFSILALGEYSLALFHLLIHALFKALLFMCAGCMIHNMGNCQDIRSMGSLIELLPMTCTFFIISNLALCGLPFLSGFYSKDLILEVMSMTYLNLYIYLVFFISVGLTVSYTFRLLYYILTGDFNYSALNMVSDNGKIMLQSMAGLIMGVVMGGSMLMWLMFPTPYFICLPLFMKLMTLGIIFIGAWFGYMLSKFAFYYTNKSMNIMSVSLFMGSMWNMPYITLYGVTYYPIMSGRVIYESSDQGWSEFLGSQNIYMKMKVMSGYFQFMYSNNLKVFMLLLVLWVLFMAPFL